VDTQDTPPRRYVANHARQIPMLSSEINIIINNKIKKLSDVKQLCGDFQNRINTSTLGENGHRRRQEKRII